MIDKLSWTTAYPEVVLLVMACVVAMRRFKGPVMLRLMRVSATTRLPRVLWKDSAVAFLSPDMLASTNQ